MKTRIPSAGTPVRVQDLLAAGRGLWSRRADAFCEALRVRMDARCVGVVNSGTTAFYATLKALCRRSPRREVILPAYTAPSLTLPVKKAGLVPKLCEVSLDTLNLDPDRLDAAITSETLCVVPVHMFGLACDLDAIHRVIANREVRVVEDAASSFGTRIGGRETGTLGDVGFLSFNRGKNLSTLAGGAFITADTELFALIDEERRTLPALNRPAQIRIMLKLFGLALAVRPLGYTLFYTLIQRFKYTALHTDFVSFQFPDVLAGVGLALLHQADAIIKRRHENGRYLARALDGAPGLRLPAVLPQSYPAYNQFPVLVENASLRQKLVAAIFDRTGAEATTLYPEPLHRIYDLGYPGPGDPFPNATHIAHHLLLLPTHPFMHESRLSGIASAIMDTLKRFVL